MHTFKLGLALIFICFIKSTLAKFQLEPALKWLNDRLTEVVKTDDLQENFAWIRQVDQDNNWILKESEKANIDHYELRLELRRLLDLERLDKDQKCDEADYQKLKEQNDRQGGLAHRFLTDLYYLNRIDRILHQVLVSHAKKCAPIHLQKFNKIHSSLDPAQEAKVAKVMDKMLYERNPLQWHNLAYRDSIMDFHLPAIEEMAKDDNDEDSDLIFGTGRKFYVSSKREERIEKLLDKYFFDPCGYYVVKLGTFFDVALFDTVMLKGLKELELHDIEKNTFRAVRDRYLLCKKTVGKYRPKLHKKFMEVVKTSTKSYERPIPGR